MRALSAEMTVMNNDLSDVKVTDRFSLSGKNFLITGGGRGIGFACAKTIAQLGGGIAVIDTLLEPTGEFMDLSQRFGVKTSYVRGDVTNQKSLEDAIALSVNAMGGQLHGGLTAAGICIDEPTSQADWENSQRTFNANIMGTFWTIKILIDHLIRTKTPGSIVAIASVNGHGIWAPIQPQAAYNASKAAVKGLVGPLAGEFGRYGIRINSISPGAIRTPLLKRLEGGEKQKILDWYTYGSPLGRLGLPEDLTPVVCYLLSEAASYTTGADFVVSGGWHAGTMFTKL